MKALFLFLSLTAHAGEECHTHFWKLTGNMNGEALAYDQFLRSLPADVTAPINDYIRKHGLLLQLNAPSGAIRGYENYLSGEGTSGPSVGMFLKYMRVVPISNVSLDTVYEVENEKSNRPLKKWAVPFGAAAPAAIDGFELVFPETLAGICEEISRKIYLAVSIEGIYRAMGRDTYPATTAIPEKDCTAQRTFFKRSKTAACGKFTDLESGKTRILVWNARIR